MKIQPPGAFVAPAPSLVAPKLSSPHCVIGNSAASSDSAMSTGERLTYQPMALTHVRRQRALAYRRGGRFLRTREGNRADIRVSASSLLPFGSRVARRRGVGLVVSGRRNMYWRRRKMCCFSPQWRHPSTRNPSRAAFVCRQRVPQVCLHALGSGGAALVGLLQVDGGSPWGAKS